MAKTRRKKSPSSKKATAVSYHKNSIWAEVRLVVLLVASLFLFISNFGAGGWMGNMCSFVLFGCLGIFAYLFPLFVLFLVLFSLANKENLFATVKMIAAVVGCVVVSALLHILMVSREVRVASRSISPIMFLRVVAVRFSIAEIGRSIP